MKVIFIDIDGPLAWGTWGGGRVEIKKGPYGTLSIPYPWVKEDCDALAVVLEKTDARLVISSDWKKHYSFNHLRDIFLHYRISPWSIIDMTPNHSNLRKMSGSLEWDRACEIHSWVKMFKPTQWIAIDDLPLKSSFSKLGITQYRHVQVDGDFGYGGRLRDKIDKCVKILNKPFQNKEKVIF